MVLIVKANDGALFNLIKITQFVIDDLGPGGFTKLLQQAAANLLDNCFTLSGFGWPNATGFGPARRAAIANDRRPAVQPINRHTGHMPRSDFEILEARLQELETQIKNQQRDLHTLLQKLRDITAKSKPLAERKKTKGAAKWVFGFLFFAGGLAAAYFTLGVDAIVQAGYSAIGQMVALIDMLSTYF